jgi:single-stranded DNA-binding protein
MAGETVITVIGNLTADPELRFTPSGAAVANFTVASTPRTFDRQSQEWKDGEALFLRCNVWRQAAENVAESLTRGSRVIVRAGSSSAPSRRRRARSAPSSSWRSTRSARRSATPPRRSPAPRAATAASTSGTSPRREEQPRDGAAALHLDGALTMRR